MGIYIDWPDRLNIGKAARLRNDHGAEDFKGVAWSDVPEGKVLVAVAENREGQRMGEMISEKGVTPIMQGRNFDAALVVYDEAEWEWTQFDDSRTIQWLLLDRAEALKLAPELAQV